MATYLGTSGSVLFTTTSGPGTNNEAQCYQWSLTMRHDVTDVTPFNPSSNFKRFIGGMSDATGNIAFYLDLTAAANLKETTAFSGVDKAPATLVLKTKASGAGKSFTFGALLSNLTVDVERQSVIRCTADFESSGLITIANVA